MGLTYNKEFQSKDRRIMTSGPRDRQLKQALQSSMVTSDQSLLVEELRSQINKLQEQLDKKINVVGYTAEQVNDEIMKAVKAETQKLQDRNDALAREISSYVDIIKNKDILIQSLTNNQSISDSRLTELLAETNRKIENMVLQINSNQENIIVDSDRPKMETIFVDPIEGQRNVEKHFEVEDISVSEKVQMDDKVNKLRGLLGKLPNQKN